MGDEEAIRRLALVRPVAIEPIKTLIGRHSRYQWLVLGTFAQLNLSHFGRFAIDNALLNKVEIPGFSESELRNVRSSTPNHDLIRKNGEHQKELWNLFFIAMWAEFEAAIDDIRIELLRNTVSLAKELLTDHANFDEPEKIARTLRKRVGDSRLSKFECDLKTYELFGFSVISNDVAEVLVEANAIRNVLIHRRGVIDERAMKDSENLRGRASPILLDGKDYMRFWTATWAWAQAYLGDLIALDKLMKSGP